MEIDAYLSEKNKRRKKKRAIGRIVLVFIALYAVLTAAGWTILRAPVFAARNIVVRGNDAVASGDVVALLQSSALRDHNFIKSVLTFRNMFVWPSGLSARDLAFAPELAAVSVRKDYWSHTVTADVTERKPFAIWCAMPSGDQKCYWFDDTGIIFKKAFDTQGSLVLAIHDYSQSDLGLGKPVLPDLFVGNLISIVNVLKAGGIDAKEVALKDIGLQEIDVTTYDGPDLYFSLRFPADNDLAVLQSLMAKPTFKDLQYVDFRVENRAYYK